MSSVSLWSAGRDVHTRIVAVGLMAAIVFVMVGTYSRITTSEMSVAAGKADGLVVRVGQPASYTDGAKSSIR
jgi:hypothetical protein